MAKIDQILSYIEMCQEEGTSFQRGMNFRLQGGPSVVLMSRRIGAPYSDRVEDEGRTLIYEGHDVPRTRGGPDPKTLDQPMRYPGGRLTQNGLFFDAVTRYRNGLDPAEIVKVYEKIRDGIWVFNGQFQLVDAWSEQSSNRQVFKFRLELIPEAEFANESGQVDLRHDRVIPASVKVEVWRRDKGRCVLCGSQVNLHFDHIIPYSRGGSSLVSENIQLLCARHNLEKRDRID